MRVRVLAVSLLAVLAMSAVPAGTATAEPAPLPAPEPAPPAAPPQPADIAKVDPKIVGGDRTSIADQPWTVYLRTASGFQFCGGTLVGPSSVVTAAHCTAGSAPASMTVVAGREDKQSQDGVVAAVTRIWVHPAFDRATYRNDVSVLTLDRPLPYRTLPVATPAEGGLYTPGAPADILGWGTTETGNSSRYLLKATVPLGDDGFCAQGYGQQYDPATMVCAGYPQGGVDTCQGDSGGPLVSGGRLIGITSFGIGCAEPGHPGVYTRVSRFADDIAAQIPR